MTGLAKMLRSIALIGFPNGLRALRYARKKDSWEARFPLPPVDGTPREPGRLDRVAEAPSGARLVFEHADLTVRFLAPDFVFLSWDGAAMLPSWAVVKADWPETEVKREPRDGGLLLLSASMGLSISREGVLRVQDRDGRLIREEGPVIRRGRSWSQKITISKDACLYGLGGRSTTLDRRMAVKTDGGPSSFRFWNSDAGGYGPGADPLYLCMPVYLCADDNGSHLVFHDNSFDGSLTTDPEMQVGFVDGPCRAYIAVGKPANILERFTALTGRPPLPPMWALGYHHSRWGFRTEKELRRVFRGFQSHDLPLSVLHLDIDQLRGNRTFTINPPTHPRFPSFIKELAASDVHLVAISDPGIKRDALYQTYAEGMKENAFCRLPDGRPFVGVVWPGWSAYPDFTGPGPRAWWGRQYRGLLDMGIDGFWHDMNEPTSFADRGALTFPSCVRHDMDGRGGDHREAHNVYGLLMNRAGYEGLRTLRPDRRPFILTRSGWVGIQRYAWTWSGDVDTSWDMLRRTVPYVIGLGLCGMPYSGPDIGGFVSVPSTELFVRWFQLAAFLPFFRTHCAVFLPRREPWLFGQEALLIVREHLKLRYRMLPHWYTLAYRAGRDGAPIVRPLFWPEPHRAELRRVEDAFLLGDDILVAPVMTCGRRTRSVLPPAGGWYVMDGEILHDERGPIDLDGPLDRTPVLVRAGAIIPMRNGDRGIVLHAYASAGDGACGGALYSDAGDGYGPHRLDTFVLARAGDAGYALQWSTEGGFPWPYPSVTLRLHGYAKGTRVEAKGPGGIPVTVTRA